MPIAGVWSRRIRDARLARGLTQAQLATAMDVTNQTISRWERGEVTPPDVAKERLAEVLAVAVGELFAWPDVEVAAS